MDDRAALIAAILAEPDDLLPRLVFADWLGDHGEWDRAAWMRASCEPGVVVPGSAQRRQADKLFAACRPEWWEQARPYLSMPKGGLLRMGVLSAYQADQFRRQLWLPGAIRGGWVGSVYVAGSQWTAAAITPWEPPLRGVPLEVAVATGDVNDGLAPLLADPNLRVLSLFGRAIGLLDIDSLGTPGGIWKLKLAAFDARIDTAPVFEQIPRLTGLRQLSISGRRAAYPTAGDFRAVGRAAGLRCLTLAALPHLADADLAALAGLTYLVRLELRDCPAVSEAAVAELRRALPGVTVVRRG